MIKDVDMFKKTLSEIEVGYIIAQCTDKLIIEKINKQSSLDFEHLYSRAFDIRIFNKESEIHIFRSSIDKEFKNRIINSDENAIEYKEENYSRIIEDESVSVYYDEEQFLDIDTTKIDSVEHKVRATGGGIYKLPIDKYSDAKIIIRNYLGFEKDTGRAYVKDWRIVDFKEGK